MLQIALYNICDRHCDDIANISANAANFSKVWNAPLNSIAYELIYLWFVIYELWFMTYLLRCDLFAYVCTYVSIYLGNMNWSLYYKINNVFA
jgi:hypothetical protein